MPMDKDRYARLRRPLDYLAREGRSDAVASSIRAAQVAIPDPQQGLSHYASSYVLSTWHRQWTGASMRH